MTANYIVMWEMVKHGLGLGIQDSLIGDAEPLVSRALPDLEPLIFSMWLVAHRDLNNSRRIRVVFDLLAAVLVKQDVSIELRVDSSRCLMGQNVDRC
jgi:DNA-binding transcriptional LysR family regulator